MFKTMMIADCLRDNGCASTVRPTWRQAMPAPPISPPTARSIYAAVVAAGPTLETLRTTVETQARSLVMDGKVAMGSGRENAQAAGECVRARLQ